MLRREDLGELLLILPEEPARTGLEFLTGLLDLRMLRWLVAILPVLRRVGWAGLVKSRLFVGLVTLALPGRLEVLGVALARPLRTPTLGEDRGLARAGALSTAWRLGD